MASCVICGGGLVQPRSTSSGTGYLAGACPDCGAVCWQAPRQRHVHRAPRGGAPLVPEGLRVDLTHPEARWFVREPVGPWAGGVAVELSLPLARSLQEATVVSLGVGGASRHSEWELVVNGRRPRIDRDPEGRRIEFLLSEEDAVGVDVLELSISVEADGPAPRLTVNDIEIRRALDAGT